MRLFSLAVVVVLLAGCAGSDGEPKSSPTLASSAAPATVTDQTGGIEGAIVNDEAQPVPNADVGIVQTNNLTKSAADGGYSFSGLEPGEYTVTAALLGYESTAKKVVVVAGEVTKADFTLQPVSLDSGPIIETLERRGFINCSINPLYSMNLCGNTMQDQAHFNFELRKDLKAKELLIELVFRTTSPVGAKRMEINVCDRIPNQTNQLNCFDYDDYYKYRSGASPVELRDKQVPKDLHEYQVSVGAGQLSTGSPEVPLMFQQPFTVYITGCYVEECGEEFHARPPDA